MKDETKVAAKDPAEVIEALQTRLDELERANEALGQANDDFASELKKKETLIKSLTTKLKKSDEPTHFGGARTTQH